MVLSSILVSVESSRYICFSTRLSSEEANAEIDVAEGGSGPLPTDIVLGGLEGKTTLVRAYPDRWLR